MSIWFHFRIFLWKMNPMEILNEIASFDFKNAMSRRTFYSAEISNEFIIDILSGLLMDNKKMTWLFLFSLEFEWLAVRPTDRRTNNVLTWKCDSCGPINWNNRRMKVTMFSEIEIETNFMSICFKLENKFPNTDSNNKLEQKQENNQFIRECSFDCETCWNVWLSGILDAIPAIAILSMIFTKQNIIICAFRTGTCFYLFYHSHEIEPYPMYFPTNLPANRRHKWWSVKMKEVKAISSSWISFSALPETKLPLIVT